MKADASLKSASRKDGLRCGIYRRKDLKRIKCAHEWKVAQVSLKAECATAIVKQKAEWTKVDNSKKRTLNLYVYTYMYIMQLYLYICKYR